MGRAGRDLGIGVTFALALAIFAVAILIVGGDTSVFSPRRKYLVTFPSADGLMKGSPVKMAGVQVGAVTDIDLPTDPEAHGIQVEIAIDSDYAARVRQDSRAALRTAQLLTGEKLVEVTPGSPGGEELADRASIETLEESELFEQAADTAGNIHQLTLSLGNILEDVESGQGVFGRLINDPELADETLGALKTAVENAQLVSRRLLEGRGVVGRLINDDELAGKLDDAGDAITRFQELVASIDLDQGALGELTRDGGQGTQILDDLAVAANDLKEVAARVRSDDGLLGKLLNDPEYSAELAENLGRTTANLAEISDKINRGEGTLGLLVNDRTLHDDLAVIVSGVNDDKFTKWLLRRYRKKGIKVYERGEQAIEEGG